MISRRSVRIKVMQAIYGLERTENTPYNTFELSLEKSILSVKDLYLYLLLSVREVANMVEHEAEIKASKFLPTEEDKKFSTKLLSNTLIQYLNHDEAFNKAVKKAGLLQKMESHINRSFYKMLEATDRYKAYIQAETDFDFQADREIAALIFNDILLQDETFLQQVEDVFPSWDDDAEFVVEAVREVFKKSKDELKLHIQKQTLQDKFEELISFGRKLMQLCIEEKDESLELIKPYLRNWEMDRIAVLDLIMLRMAIAEFQHFNSIPVKVSMNEYIDISKDYSTPKSKDFINGVLDRMMREMKTRGLISKTGRGLIEQ